MRRQRIDYDPARQEPAVQRSICTGEMTVGFVDRQTGKFHGLMLARNQKELDDFRRRVGAETLRTIY